MRWKTTKCRLGELVLNFRTPRSRKNLGRLGYESIFLIQDRVDYSHYTVANKHGCALGYGGIQ